MLFLGVLPVDKLFDDLRALKRSEEIEVFLELVVLLFEFLMVVVLMHIRSLKCL